jgi:hypothetical protein
MITIQVDTKEVTRLLNDIQRKQIPFATSVALNKTAQDVQAGLVEGMSVFDRPKPFTLRGVFVTRSTKANLTATIGLKTRDKGGPVSEYLAANITGGGRVDKRSEILLRNAGILPAGKQTRPGPDARLDAYGNMSRGQIVQILSYFRAFGSIATSGRGSAGGTKSTKINASTRKPRTRALFVTPSGVYERKRGQVQGLLTFTQPERYQKRYDFTRIATDVVQRQLDRNFKAALEHALATAR